MQNERKVLVSALLKAEKNGYSNLILDNVLKDSELTSANKSFVTSAFYGILERKLSIDYVLNCFLKKPIEKTPPYTSAVLRSGAYQIIFMDKIPLSAAVNESVKLIKKSKEAGNSGLVNAVLRKIGSENFKEKITNHTNPSVKFSVEQWMYNLVLNNFSANVANSFFESALSAPPLFLRINTLVENAYDDVLKEITELGGSLTATVAKDTYLANGVRNIEALDSYRNGFVFVQDLSSRLATIALDAKVGERIFDCCAAPGGKTFSIAIDMQNEGEVVSADIYPQRVNLINSGAKRLGLDIIKTLVNDASVYDKNLGVFDRVICDAPCSGVGVIRRKPEIKYKKDEDCNSLPEIQKNILQTASQYVKNGGRLVYSTCTILKRENDDVVNDFLANNSDFHLVSAFDGGVAETITFLPPTNAGDGFYIAVMERS